MIRGVVIHQWDGGYFLFRVGDAEVPEDVQPTKTRWRPDPPGGVELPIKGVDASSPLDHVNPEFGATVFFLAGILKWYPAFRVPAFLIGVGGAVLNYGSQRAGGGEQWSSGGGGGF